MGPPALQHGRKLPGWPGIKASSQARRPRSSQPSIWRFLPSFRNLCISVTVICRSAQPEDWFEEVAEGSSDIPLPACEKSVRA